jgi:DNA-binding NarL/FixJ family response regulator
MNKTKILVVDDHAIVRQGIAMLIDREKDMHVCCQAVDGESAMLACQSAVPLEIAIVDLSLPGISGLALIKKIRLRYPKIGILALSMHDENIYAERALKAGANGYLMKQEAPATMLKAIRKILRGELYVSERMHTRLLQRLIHKQASNCPVAGLTQKEYEIFSMIGKGLGPSKIAVQLNRSIKTVEKHKSNIRQKLQLDAATNLTSFAIQFIAESQNNFTANSD